jgi:hypothetical protein
MKRVILLIAAAGLAVLAGCNLGPSVVYTEKSDLTNNVTPELAGDLASSLAIKGTISSGSDTDLYRVDVGSVTTLEYEVLYNGKSQKNILGISIYPFDFTTYDSLGNVLNSYIYMAGLGSYALDPGTSYIIFYFYGDGTHTSGSYELDLM